MSRWDGRRRGGPCVLVGPDGYRRLQRAYWLDGPAAQMVCMSGRRRDASGSINIKHDLLFLSVVFLLNHCYLSSFFLCLSEPTCATEASPPAQFLDKQVSLVPALRFKHVAFLRFFFGGGGSKPIKTMTSRCCTTGRFQRKTKSITRRFPTPIIISKYAS